MSDNTITVQETHEVWESDGEDKCRNCGQADFISVFGCRDEDEIDVFVQAVKDQTDYPVPDDYAIIFDPEMGVVHITLLDECAKQTTP